MSRSDDEMDYVSAEDEDYAPENDSEGEDAELRQVLAAAGGGYAHIDDDDEELEEDDDNDDDDEESIDEDEDEERASIFYNLISHSRTAYSTVINRLEKLSTYTPPVLTHDLADELNMKTAAIAPGTPTPPVASLAEHHRGNQRVLNPCHIQLLREGGHTHIGSNNQRDPATMHFSAYHRLPTRPVKVVDRMASRGYIGQFTKDGQAFVAAFQNERRIKLYDVHTQNWMLFKNIHARGLRWTVTDIALSNDQKFLLYSSITPTVHLVNIDRSGVNSEAVESIANVTDVHEALHLGDSNNSNGIWSLRWSRDNTEIIAGTADRSLYIYDMHTAKTVVRVAGHDDDVNAVAYADDSSNIIFTGSDDNMIKIWDRRLLRSSSSSSTSSSSGGGKTPVGVFVGHSEGIAYLDSKMDGRYLISNSKDQTIKLWDIRSTKTAKQAAEIRRKVGSTICGGMNWDYRWMEYPAQGRVVEHPHDVAIATYRGHSVLSTLIRAYWSPEHTTGQRYIYTASADGSVRIYDVVTAKEVGRLGYHKEVVRDCSWHPFLPLLATVSFDGTICAFEPETPGDREALQDEKLAKQQHSNGSTRRSTRSSAASGASNKAAPKTPPAAGGGSGRRSGLPAPGGDQLGPVIWFVVPVPPTQGIASVSDQNQQNMSEAPVDGYGKPIQVFTREAEFNHEAQLASSSQQPDVDYEFHEGDYHVIAAGFAAARAKQSRGLITKKHRQDEEERRIASYGPIPLRIEFPDGYVIQASFPVTTPLRQVHDLVASVLHPSHKTNFHLFTTPPKSIFKKKDLDETTLYSARLIPAARLHVGLDSLSTSTEGATSTLLAENIVALCTEPPPKASALKQKQQQQQQQQEKSDTDNGGVQRAVAGTGQKKGGGSGGGVPKWMRLATK